MCLCCHDLMKDEMQIGCPTAKSGVAAALSM